KSGKSDPSTIKRYGQEATGMLFSSATSKALISTEVIARCAGLGATIKARATLIETGHDIVGAVIALAVSLESSGWRTAKRPRRLLFFITTYIALCARLHICQPSTFGSAECRCACGRGATRLGRNLEERGI
ncbi:MAG: hypothetical protein AAGI88_17230, partial [Pseudomonadota bacterium]